MSGHPTPEAVEAVGNAITGVWDDEPTYAEQDLADAAAREALAFIRDAIHRDGPDAQAIRDALGLGVENDDDGRRPHQFPRSAIGEDVLAWACVACGTVVSEYGSGASGECPVNWRYPVERRRVVGEWQEVQS